MFPGIVKGTMTTTHSYTGDQVQDPSTTCLFEFNKGDACSETFLPEKKKININN